MANLSIYYPSPIVAGSVAGTYADGGRAALKDLSNTFAQNQTFNGTNNTAPSQTAASGSSLMTRDLVDDEDFFNLGAVYRPAAFAFGFSGTGSAASSTGGDQRLAAMNCGTSPSGYARATLTRGLMTVPGLSGGGIQFSYKIGISCRVFIGAASLSNTDSRIRLVVGGNGGVPATADANALSVVGFGWEYAAGATAHQWRLFAHNGTSYVTSAWQTFGPANILYTPVYLAAYSDGAGNITGYFAINGSRSLSSVTLSGGPTTNGVAANSYADLVVVNSTTGTTQLPFALADCRILTRL